MEFNFTEKNIEKRKKFPLPLNVKTSGFDSEISKLWQGSPTDFEAFNLVTFGQAFSSSSLAAANLDNVVGPWRPRPHQY
jgi:hypothetical protein